MYNYDDVIEYIDCTYDENFEDAKHWCNENNAQLIELVERREEKEIEEPDVLDNSKTNKVIKLYRYFQIQENPKYVPTEKDLLNQDLWKYKGELQATDYKCLKFVDGALTEEEYAEVRTERQALRDKINEIQAKIDALEEEKEASAE